MPNVTSKVQNGETLSLYANMYGCTVDEIIKANSGVVGKDGKVPVGANIVIPIGQPPKEQAKPNSVLEEKVQYFDRKVEEAKIRLYDDKLSKQQREAYEAEYIQLKNQKKERDKYAQVSLTGDGYHMNLTIKEDISIADFRRLFPECGKNFSDYADETDQTEYVNGKGFVRDPKKIILKKGTVFQLKTQEYANQGFFSELGTSIKKTLGIKP